MSYEYLAGPYSANPEKNYEIHARVLAQLLSMGRHSYSPIVQCHHLAVQHDMPRDFNFWRNYNMAMLGPASKLTVICSDGWLASEGLAAERQMADRLGLEVEYLNEEFWSV